MTPSGNIPLAKRRSAFICLAFMIIESAVVSGRLYFSSMTISIPGLFASLVDALHEGDADRIVHGEDRHFFRTLVRGHGLHPFEETEIPPLPHERRAAERVGIALGKRLHMPAHRDVDHLVLLGNGHDCGAGRSGIASRRRSALSTVITFSIRETASLGSLLSS